MKKRMWLASGVKQKRNLLDKVCVSSVDRCRDIGGVTTCQRLASCTLGCTPGSVHGEQRLPPETGQRAADCNQGLNTSQSFFFNIKNKCCFMNKDEKE